MQMSLDAKTECDPRIITPEVRVKNPEVIGILRIHASQNAKGGKSGGTVAELCYLDPPCRP